MPSVTPTKSTESIRKSTGPYSAPNKAQGKAKSSSKPKPPSSGFKKPGFGPPIFGPLTKEEAEAKAKREEQQEQEYFEWRKRNPNGLYWGIVSIGGF